MANDLVKREAFKKYVGYFEGEVVAVNPDLDGLSKLGINLEDEPEYVKEVDDKEKDASGELQVVGKVKQVSVIFYIRDKKTGAIFPYRLFLKNKIRMDKTKTKTQFMNSQGASSWAEEESGLHEFMTKNGQSVRKAYEGEADLYDFVKTWLNQADFKKDYELVFDWKKIMSGNVKEIAKFVNSDVAGSIMVPATVKVDQESGKEYQQVWGKGIVAGFVIKQLRLKKIDDDFIERADMDKREKKKLSPLQRSVLAVTDGGGQYKCPDFYYLGEMKEYDEKDNFVASGAPVDPTDASY